MAFSTRDDALKTGRKLLRLALYAVYAFAIASVGWVVLKAIQNPDVRAKQPSWREEPLDIAFWSPLLVTLVVGAGLVAYVFYRAYQRMAEGEDLFAKRYGRGQRRRGERFLTRQRRDADRPLSFKAPLPPDSRANGS